MVERSSIERPTSLAFVKIAKLHELLKLPNLAVLRLWEYRLDASWEIVLNGTSEEQAVCPTNSMGAKVAPYHAAIFYNGWWAGEISPYGGWIAAGAGANEDTFIEALDGAIAKVRLAGPAASER